MLDQETLKTSHRLSYVFWHLHWFSVTVRLMLGGNADRGRTRTINQVGAKLLRQTLACLFEISARSEPCFASPGAGRNSTVSKTQVGKVARFCRSTTSLGAEQTRDDFRRTQTMKDARWARATTSLGARENTFSPARNTKQHVWESAFQGGRQFQF